MSRALGGGVDSDEEDSVEDQINRIIEAKKLLPNASYFALTATPKNKTLEMFGEPVSNPDGTVGHRPFHSYTMKQAIQEGFIVDVLANYTPVGSYYKLMKTVEDDPEFDVKRASKKLRAYVEGNQHAIAQKADIMVEHFLGQVIAKQKIGGQSRAMVVTSSIPRCIEYFHAIRDALAARKSPYKVIVAFSGEHDYKGVQVTEASLNGFPSRAIAEQIKTDPYRLRVIVKTCGSACHATFCWRPDSSGRSTSLPRSKVAPARTRATRCGALTARQRRCADSMSLNAIAMPAAREPGPLVTR